jgi:hypothetical protein
VVYLHNVVFFIHKEEWNYIVCRKMDGIGGHNVNCNKPDWERQIFHILSQMWNLDLNKRKELHKYKTGTV